MILQEGDFNYKEQIAYRIRDFYYNLSEIIDLDIEKMITKTIPEIIINSNLNKKKIKEQIEGIIMTKQQRQLLIRMGI